MSFGPAIALICWFFIGIGMGFALVIAPIYIAEISPPKSRGFLTSLPEICISIGMMLGIVSSRSFDWTVVSGISAVPSLALPLVF